MATENYFVMSPDRRPKALNVIGTKVTVLAASSETQAFGITFQEGGEGSGPPPHSHNWDEAFYILSGEIQFQCGDDMYRCLPGTLVYVPRNTVHGFTYGKGGGSMVEITSRDGHAAEMFTAIDAGVDPSSPDLQQTVEILENCGVHVRAEK